MSLARIKGTNRIKRKKTKQGKQGPSNCGYNNRTYDRYGRTDATATVRTIIKQIVVVSETQRICEAARNEADPCGRGYNNEETKRNETDPCRSNSNSKIIYFYYHYSI